MSVRFRCRHENRPAACRRAEKRRFREISPAPIRQSGLGLFSDSEVFRNFVDAFLHRGLAIGAVFGSVDRFEPAKRLKCLQSCGIMKKKGGEAMFGAIYGDVIGSYYEVHCTKDYNFEFNKDSFFTDDSVLIAAVCKAILYNQSEISQWTLRTRAKEYASQYRQY